METRKVKNFVIGLLCAILVVAVARVGKQKELINYLLLHSDIHSAKFNMNGDLVIKQKNRSNLR